MSTYLASQLIQDQEQQDPSKKKGKVAQYPTDESPSDTDINNANTEPTGDTESLLSISHTFNTKVALIHAVLTHAGIKDHQPDEAIAKPMKPESRLFFWGLLCIPKDKATRNLLLFGYFEMILSAMFTIYAWYEHAAPSPSLAYMFSGPTATHFGRKKISVLNMSCIMLFFSNQSQSPTER